MIPSTERPEHIRMKRQRDDARAERDEARRALENQTHLAEMARAHAEEEQDKADALRRALAAAKRHPGLMAVIALRVAVRAIEHRAICVACRHGVRCDDAERLDAEALRRHRAVEFMLSRLNSTPEVP